MARAVHIPTKRERETYGFDVLGCLCRGLKERKAVVLGELGSLLGRHLALSLEIALVADQHDDDVLVRVASAVLEPALEVVKGLAARDIIHQQSSGSASVVRSRDRAELLLASLFRTPPASQHR